MIAMLWSLTARSAWGQPPTVLESMRGEGDDLASVRCVAVGSSTTVVANKTGECTALSSFRSIGLGSTCHCVTGTVLEGVALVSVMWVGLGPASHCGGGNDTCVRCSGDCSLVRSVLSQPLWWRAQKVRALIWPLIARWAWAQPATVVARTTGKGAPLATVCSVSLGIGSHCLAGTTGVGAALASLL